MQKIMFNDRLGLTKAVLNGIKRQTRRTVNKNIITCADMSCVLGPNEEDKNYLCYETADGEKIDIRLIGNYKVGEVVAVAQAYKDIPSIANSNFVDVDWDRVSKHKPFGKWGCASNMPGWKNKMFVRADQMPHHIRITGIRVQHLQDISDEDILKEGVTSYFTHGVDDAVRKYTFEGSKTSFFDARSAFAALIDKVSGKGTWDSNPWVFAYDIELVD